MGKGQKELILCSYSPSLPAKMQSVSFHLVGFLSQQEERACSVCFGRVGLLDCISFCCWGLSVRCRLISSFAVLTPKNMSRLVRLLHWKTEEIKLGSAHMRTCRSLVTKPGIRDKAGGSELELMATTLTCSGYAENQPDAGLLCTVCLVLAHIQFFNVIKYAEDKIYCLKHA